jgi:predicted Zn-dependent protease
MKVYLLLILLACVSCATRTPVTDKLQRHAESFRIKNVPVIEQKDHHCGPATLAMVMQYHGKKKSPEELAQGLFHKKLKGSFFSEVKARARSEGMMVLEVNDLEKAFAEVRAGNPVIILENNGFPLFPRWHFAVLTGMDFDGPDVYLNDGDDEVNERDMRWFERSFILGGRRTLVVLPPEKLSQTSSEIEHVEAATMLEAAGKIPEAKTAFLSILKRWPESLLGSLGAANNLYATGEKKEALEILKKSSDAHPDSPLIWHNLAILQGENGMKIRARMSAKKALGLAPKEQKDKFLVSLKDWL